MIYESQKRAMKNWQKTHKEHVKEYNKKWREGNEDYRLKQIGYVKAYRHRKKITDEFRILCSIEIF
jgi:hypothetical protein